jgi:hypothetical protein
VKSLNFTVWPCSVDCLLAVNSATVNLYASSVAYPELQITLHHVALAEHVALLYHVFFLTKVLS